MCRTEQEDNVTKDTILFIVLVLGAGAVVLAVAAVLVASVVDRTNGGS